MEILRLLKKTIQQVFAFSLPVIIISQYVNVSYGQFLFNLADVIQI